MLQPRRPPLIDLYPDNPHPSLSSLSHGDFRDRENEKSYAIKKRQLMVEEEDEGLTAAELFYSLAA